MFCSNCGTEANNTAKFCSGCGAPAARTIAVDQTKVVAVVKTPVILILFTWLLFFLTFSSSDIAWLFLVVQLILSIKLVRMRNVTAKINGIIILVISAVMFVSAFVPAFMDGYNSTR